MGETWQSADRGDVAVAGAGDAIGVPVDR